MGKVSNFKALISGNSWNGMADNGTPVFVTYCFMKNSNVPSRSAYEPYSNNGYKGFSSTQKQSFRQAVDKFENAAGIKFIEVNDPDEASIKVMSTSGSNWGGWAAYSYSSENYSSNDYLVIDGSGSFKPGTSEFEILLHELGHATGLKHPFDGNPNLVDRLDNDNHTLMSYTSNGKADKDLAHLDKDALAFLYGESKGIKNAWKWKWKEKSDTFVLKGSNGKDKLLGVDAKSVIDGKGGRDLIIGRDADDKLKGGGGKDTILGGDGDDRIQSGKGNDSVAGGDGADTFVFKVNSDRDRINDFENNYDQVLLHTRLWSGNKTPAEIVAEFAVQDGSHVRLNFGNGDVLTIKNTNTAFLADDIGFV